MTPPLGIHPPTGRPVPGHEECSPDTCAYLSCECVLHQIEREELWEQVRGAAWNN